MDNLYKPKIMNGIATPLLRGNCLIKTMTIACEVVMCNCLFVLLWTFFEAKGSDCKVWLSEPKMMVLLTLCYLLSALRVGTVLQERKVMMYQVLAQVLKTVSLFALVLVGVVIFGNILEPRTWFFVCYLLSFLTVSSVVRLTLRSLVKRLRSHGKNIHHVVLVGASRSNVELWHEMMDDGTNGYKVEGYFDDQPNEQFDGLVPYLGTPEEVDGFLSSHPLVRFVFCSLHSHESERIIRILDYCENHLVHFYSVPNLHNYLHNRVYLNMFGEVPVLSLHNSALDKTENKLLKRLFDIVFSLAFLCTLFPFVFLIVSIVTKLTMPGPVFFRQKRSGLNDEEFYCLKFRSMKVNKDADRLQATKNDPRKTRWGEILRKTSIDELPQFINVLMGDMSVVGPRPHMLKHTEEYSKLIDKYMVRHFVKPGITGWSQVTGFRGETKELKDMEGRVKGDIWYIEHWTFMLDLYIIYKTVANAVGGDQQAY